MQAVFDKAGFGSYFGHGLGHSVGLEIHEEPRFSRNVKEQLPAGTVISVEPGLYVPGLAVCVLRILLCSERAAAKISRLRRKNCSLFDGG